MSSGEVYDALSKKVIDGAISGPSTFVDRKWYEVSSYPVTNFFNETLHALICNLDWWNSLPKDQQAALLEAGKKARDFTRVEAKKAEDEGWAKLKAMPKMELITLSDAEMKRWAEIVVPYEEKVIIKAIGEQEYKRLRAIVEKHRKPAAK
jgi:TRAP-type C4-dicarboxylate transport system substrate-binding protein